MQPIVCVCSACARLAKLLSNAPVTVHEMHTQAQVMFFGWGALCTSSVRRSNTPTENLHIQPTMSTNSMSILDLHSHNISMPFVWHQWHVTQVWLKDILFVYCYESVCAWLFSTYALHYQQAISIVSWVLIFFFLLLMNKWDFTQLTSLLLSSNFLCA